MWSDGILLCAKSAKAASEYIGAKDQGVGASRVSPHSLYVYIHVYT